MTKFGVEQVKPVREYRWRFSLQWKSLAPLAVVTLFVIVISSASLIGLNRITEVSDAVLTKEAPTVRSIQEALAAMNVALSSAERALDIEDPTRFSELENQRLRFEQSKETFEMFIAAITWGSETEAFAKSAGGANLDAWTRAGYRGTFVVLPPTDTEAQLAGETNIYYDGFVNNAEKAIVERSNFLTLTQAGNTLEAELARTRSKEFMSQARRYGELTVDRLTEIVRSESVASVERFAFLQQTQRVVRDLLIIISVVAVIIAMLLGALFARYVIVQPIAALVEAARKFGRGDFNERVHLNTHDELELLAITFNSMADNLSAYTSQLERKVTVRTKELAEKIELNKQQLLELQQTNEQLDRSGKLLIRRDLELSRANELLQGLDRMKSEFVTLVTHQLRTPLSGVKWSLSMLLNGEMGEMTQEQKLYLMKTYESNERMIALINDILQVDRIESGKVKYQFVPTQLLNLLDNVIIETEPIAKRKNVSVEFSKREEVPLLSIDPENMRAVLQNLIENAIKYTPAGGKITIGTRNVAGAVEISVADTGIGIPKDQQKNVFKRFFRASNAIKFETEGSGLGLYIVDNIIRKHNGTVSFKSEEGKGTTFTITLPTVTPSIITAPEGAHV